MRIEALARPPSTPPVTDIFGIYTPPFRLVSEMLVTMLLCPSGPLRAAFRDVPFLSLAGKIPVIVWFATVQQITYQSDGRPARVGSPAAPLYKEMTMIAPLRGRGFFCPAIYASDSLTLQVGWGYGMPKEKRAVAVTRHDNAVTATIAGNGTDVRVRFRPGRRLASLARWLERLYPLRAWPMRFPDGPGVRPVLTESPEIVGGRVRGAARLETAWLPRRVSFLPWGLYLPRQVMIMPPVAE